MLAFIQRWLNTRRTQQDGGRVIADFRRRWDFEDRLSAPAREVLKQRVRDLSVTQQQLVAELDSLFRSRKQHERWETVSTALTGGRRLDFTPARLQRGTTAYANDDLLFEECRQLGIPEDIIQFYR